MQHVEVFRIPTGSPADVSGLEALIARGAIDPAHVIAIMGKTEGNGCVNDYTRDFATYALADVLARPLGQTREEIERRVAFVMSGGTEGVLSPHITVFERRQETAPGDGEKRLAIGVAFTRDFRPEEIGRAVQADATAEAVRVAMRDAGIASTADVHFVQIKCPLLTAAKVETALRAGQRPVTHDTYESMGWSRGASALGVALALGEI